MSGATAYEVWRGTAPYFTPGASGSVKVTTTTATSYSDPGRSGDPNTNYYYLIIATASGCPLGVSQRLGEFDFALTPGTLAGVAAVRTFEAEVEVEAEALSLNLNLNLVDTPIASFAYDADGQRIGATVDGVTTVYPFTHYEVEGTTVRKYYLIGGQRVAMRTAGALSYLLTDHLGSTAVTTDAAGARTGELRYLPFGATRTTWGIIPTDRRFTGQPRYATLGLDYFGARWYDPALGRFAQADTIVPAPGNPQALNRYSYALNNALRYRDPSGHWIETAWDIANIAWDIAEVRSDPSLLNWGALVVDVAAVAIPAVPGGAGLIARGGKAAKAAVKMASHGDEAVDAVRLAGHMGDGVHAVLTASRLRQVGAHSDEGAKLVKVLAETSTQNGRIRGGITMLGSYDEYINMAKMEGLTYFNMSTEVWDILKTSPGDLTWEVNRQFLDDSIAAGHSFVVTLGEGKTIGKYLQREIDYLIKNGYKLVDGVFVKP